MILVASFRTFPGTRWTKLIKIGPEQSRSRLAACFPNRCSPDGERITGGGMLSSPCIPRRASHSSVWGCGQKDRTALVWLDGDGAKLETPALSPSSRMLPPLGSHQALGSCWCSLMRARSEG